MKLLALLFVLTGLSASAVGVTPSPLSEDQQRRLVDGHVVVLDLLPPGGDARSSQGGTALGVVRAPGDVVWRLLVDYPRHAGLYPGVVDAAVLESDADRALVRYVVGVGPLSFGFHVNNYADAGQRRLSWRLAHDRPNDLFRESWGYWQITPARDGVLVTYAMAARTVLPAFLTRGVERAGLVETLKAVRGRAEQGA